MTCKQALVHFIELWPFDPCGTDFRVEEDPQGLVFHVRSFREEDHKVYHVKKVVRTKAWRSTFYDAIQIICDEMSREWTRAGAQ